MVVLGTKEKILAQYNKNLIWGQSKVIAPVGRVSSLTVEVFKPLLDDQLVWILWKGNQALDQAVIFKGFPKEPSGSTLCLKNHSSGQREGSAIKILGPQAYSKQNSTPFTCFIHCILVKDLIWIKDSTNKNKF